MKKVYFHRPNWPDKHLGGVKDDGGVYRSDPGLDDRIGHVDLETGKVYSRRLGPDKYIGRVELDNGKVYRQVALGPDEYLGRVHENGRMYRHESHSLDDYIGNLSEPMSIAHTGAAFLLLVHPALE